MYNHLEHHYTIVDLTKCVRGNMDGVPALIVSMPGIRGICGFFIQMLHEDYNTDEIADYANPTLAEYQAIHDHGYEAYLVASIFLSPDHSIYRKMIEDLSNSYSMGTD